MVSQVLLKGLYASSLSRRNPLSPEPWPSAKNSRLISSCIILECVPTCKLHTVEQDGRLGICDSAVYGKNRLQPLRASEAVVTVAADHRVLLSV